MKEEQNGILRTTLAQQKVNPEMGLTKEYDRKLYDSTKRKNEFRDKTFGDSKVYDDPISGKLLHKSHSAAENKYHHKNTQGEVVSSAYADHAAEVDHVVALKDAHGLLKHDAFLTDDEFKEILNSDENFRILSKKMNTEKGAQNDLQYALSNKELTTNAKAEMLQDYAKAVAVVSGKAAVQTAQNMGKEFASGARDTLVASAIPLTIEAVNHLMKVAQGEETLTDAAKGYGKTVVDIGVAGGANKLAMDVVGNALSNSSNEVLQSIAGSGQVGRIIGLAVIVGESATRYVNGEITGEEFVQEVGDKGVNMAAGLIGGQIGAELGRVIGFGFGTAVLPGGGTLIGAEVGAEVGRVLGSIIATVSCSVILNVYRTAQHLDEAWKLKEKQFKRLEQEALSAMAEQRDYFRRVMEAEGAVWDAQVRTGFEKIMYYAMEDTYNINGITQGLNDVLSLIGKTVKFKTMDEYTAQLDTILQLDI